MNLFENLQKMKEYNNAYSDDGYFEHQMKNFKFKCKKCGKEFIDKYDYPLPIDCGAAVYCPDCNGVASIMNKIPIEESTNDKVYYPNGMIVPEGSPDMDRVLTYMYGYDRDMDNSHYTTDEKQKAVDYWIKKNEPDVYEEDLKESIDDYLSLEDFTYYLFKEIQKNYNIDVDDLQMDEDSYPEHINFNFNMLRNLLNLEIMTLGEVIQ